MRGTDGDIASHGISWQSYSSSKEAVLSNGQRLWLEDLPQSNSSVSRMTVHAANKS